MGLDIPLVDEVRTGIPVPAGATRDDACAPPLRHQKKTLYLWTVVDSMDPKGTGDGSMDEGSAQLRLEYCDAPAGEEAKSSRSRATSIALDNAAGDIVRWFQGHRKGTNYESALVQRVIPDTVRTLDFRGFAMDLLFTRQIV